MTRAGRNKIVAALTWSRSTCPEIAKILGLPKWTVTRIARRAGVHVYSRDGAIRRRRTEEAEKARMLTRWMRHARAAAMIAAIRAKAAAG